MATATLRATARPDPTRRTPVPNEWGFAISYGKAENGKTVMCCAVDHAVNLCAPCKEAYALQQAAARRPAVPKPAAMPSAAALCGLTREPERSCVCSHCLVRRPFDKPAPLPSLADAICAARKGEQSTTADLPTAADMPSVVTAIRAWRERWR